MVAAVRIEMGRIKEEEKKEAGAAGRIAAKGGWVIDTMRRPEWHEARTLDFVAKPPHDNSSLE